MGRRFLLDRVDLQPAIAADYAADEFSWLGEESRWLRGVPGVLEALSASGGSHSVVRAPMRGEDHPGSAPAYWSALLYLLVYSFGWRDPGAGVRWWVDAGMPVEDERFALIKDVWVADGQFDWFCAWLWDTRPAFGTHGVENADGPSIRPPESWFQKVSASIGASGVWAPYGGGYDPLHLAWHIWPDAEMRGESTGDSSLTFDPAGGVGATLVSNNLLSWLDDLRTIPALQRDHQSERSWRVEVVVRTVGSVGVFRRSRTTGRWFAGQHRYHEVGNPAPHP